MVNFNLISFLLYTLSWISVSVSQFYTVVVEPGQEITLQCSNFSSFPTHIFWFRLADRLNASRISFMSTANSRATFRDGFQDTKFNMSSNTSVLFLEIKQVDPSDSGLYFCGELHMGQPKVFTATYLKVQDTDEPADDMDSKCKQESDVTAKLISVTLGILSVFLLMVIIGLVVQNRILKQASKEQQNLDQSESRDNDDLNYATVTFQPKAKRNQMESNVIYAATK